MLKKYATILLATLLFSYSARADEGMWLLNMIKKINEAEMKDLGLNLSAEDIYDINNASMKDGIVRLGQGMCTAEVISEKGLLLTNHHCAYDAIQSHSDTSNDYLRDGFWAQSRDEELEVEGLTASFLVRIEDVTDKVKKALPDSLSDFQKVMKQRNVFKELEKEAAGDTHYNAQVKSFFGGNEYYLFVYETFQDVRLVGAPPSSIGKFGGNTDNWMWPRHTGDFSMLRIYADKDNKPAPTSEDNVPYEPKHHFPVSMDGVEEGDFTMIMGYPGSTDRYLTSFGVKQALEIEQPARIKLRDKRLELMKADMDASHEVEIKYASKYAQVSNYYKYFKGQSKRLKELNVLQQKKDLEKEFKAWAGDNEDRQEEYGGSIKEFKQAYQLSDQIKLAEVYLQEAAFASELVRFAIQFNSLGGMLERGADEEQIQQEAAKLKEAAREHFKNYHKPTDKKITQALYSMYYENVDTSRHPGIFKEYTSGLFRSDLSGFADKMFKKSMFDDNEELMAFLDDPNKEKLAEDMGYQTMNSVLNLYRGKVGQTSNMVGLKKKAAKKSFIRGLRNMNPDKDYYPDANSTPRLTYGTVQGYDHPKDGVWYQYYTTMDGILQKKAPSTKEFSVPEKLERLYKNSEYGKYGEDGEMHVCFLSNTDITGGNSGSPVFNGDGELIGCAFDGNWEAMSGDIAYEPRLQRTISVDIRYVLFVIDKFAGAGHLIDEMTLVHDGSKNNPQRKIEVEKPSKNE